MNRAGWIFVTRYGLGKNLRLSRRLAAGNLAGNWKWSIPNYLNLLRKLWGFESSPGHQNFLIFQYNITLYLGNLESRFDSNLRGNYR